MNTDPNILVQCLGEAAFSSLPAVIRQAHLDTIHLAGTITVERGRGFGGLIAAVMRMPKNNSRCRLTVLGEHAADRMTWTRRFDGKVLRSVFRRDGAFLIEAMGPIRLRMTPVVDGGRLWYRLDEARVGPLPLRRFLMPSLLAWEGERDGRYDFEVEVGLPFIGRIVRYAGLVDLVEDASVAGSASRR
jgi:hypothetical protein